MKVRCVRVIDSMGQPSESSPWLKVGSVYHVLGIWVDPGRIRLRLVGEESTPALFEPEMFEIVSSAIPSSWAIAMPGAGCMSIGPARWSRAGFWEDYFDGKPEAVSSFEAERGLILACES